MGESIQHISVPLAHAAALMDAQQVVVSHLALGSTLIDALTEICLQIENVFDDPQARASILLFSEGRMRHGAAPHLPDSYIEAIDGTPVGPSVGSCGTAMHTGQRVVVFDIEHDPLWADYRQLALRHGLRACWSTPVFNSKRECVGSFGIYYTIVKRPSVQQLLIIDRFTHLCGFAVERDQLLSEQRRLSRDLERANRNLASFSRVVPDACIVIDEEGHYIAFYGGAEKILRIRFSALQGKRIADVVPEAVATRAMETIALALETGDLLKMDYQLEICGEKVEFEGRVVPVDYDEGTSTPRRHVLWMVRDITRRRQAEDRIEQLAFFDALTGLPNRWLLLDRLETSISQLRRHERFGVLFYFDLDNFKRINDSLGHTFGDDLLKVVVERLQPVLRQTDTLARIGGDEFALLPEIEQVEHDAVLQEALRIADKLVSCFAEPFAVNDQSYRVTGSIGISLIEPRNASADEILRHADTAMYRAKQLGGNRYCFFEDSMQAAADLKLQLEAEIHLGIDANQFVAFFQPQVDVYGKLIGAEALVRWQHPQRGLVSPFHFIEVAEQSGLIGRLQSIVLEDCCKLLRAMDQDSAIPPNLPVSINISPSQFLVPTLRQDLLNVLQRYAIPPTRIKLEITESTLMENMAATVEQILALRAEGFRFSVDDFGQGYSSLAYLQTFPIDELKIDKCFIDKILDGAKGCAIVDAIIALAHQLQLSIVAEGVEQEAQMSMLATRCIHGLQGYYFARPMPEAEFRDWARKQTGKVQ